MIPFRVKKLTKTAKAPTQENAGDLWDLYADDFCAENLKDTKYNNTELFYNIKGEAIKPSFYNEDVRVDGLLADREIYLKQLAFKKINHHKDLNGNFILHPQGRILVKTGISLELPVKWQRNRPSYPKWGFEDKEYIEAECCKDLIIKAYAVADIRPRSGLALKHGITVLNTPGTIDNSYRKEIGVILYNAGHEPYTISKGDKICQMLVRPLYPSKMEIVEDIEDTGRGGYGSTGK